MKTNLRAVCVLATSFDRGNCSVERDRPGICRTIEHLYVGRQMVHEMAPLVAREIHVVSAGLQVMRKPEVL